MSLKTEQVLGHLAAYGCLLRALAATHPKPLELMRLYLQFSESIGPKLDPELQEAFQLHSTVVEKWIPG